MYVRYIKPNFWNIFSKDTILQPIYNLFFDYMETWILIA
jgi:hypothetical protein